MNHFGHDSIALNGMEDFFEEGWKKKLGNADELIEYVTERG